MFDSSDEGEGDEQKRARRLSGSVYSFHDVDLSDGRDARVGEEEEGVELREDGVRRSGKRNSERLEREIVQTLDRMPSGKH